MGTGADPGGDLGKTLITGGGGFVGKAVAERCLAAGLETFIVGRNHYPDLARRGAHCIVGNINDRKFTDKALAGMNTVFHVAALAGIWGPWHDYYTTNVVGTENVISSCKKNKVATLVHTSTPSVVFNRESIGGGDERLPYAESPLCSYARSKIMAERAVLSANSDSLKTCALRPHLVWGPGDPHLIPRLVERGRQGRLRQVGEGDNLVDISFIDNVAHAHLLAAANLAGTATGAGKPYFISQGEPVNLWDWVNDLFREVGIRPIQSKVSFETAYRAGWLLEILYSLIRSRKEPQMTRFLSEQLAKSHYFSIENAKNDFGYTPVVSTQVGLEKTVEWLNNVK